MAIKKAAIALACTSLFASSAFSVQDVPEFEPVTIYGTGFEEPISQSLPQTEIISSTQIHKSGFNTVGDVLEKLGNVFMQQDLGVNMNASPDIRGYGATSSNNTVVLIDGIKISQNEQAPARIWSIPVESIDHIEIIRGSSTVLFGEGATAGAINIITNKQKDNLGVVSVGFGSYGTTNTNAYYSQGFNDSKLSFFGKTTNSKGYREQSESNLKAGGLQYDHSISDDASFGVRFGEDRDQANLPGFLTLFKFMQNPTLPQYALTDLFGNQPVNSTIKNQLFSAYLKWRDGDFNYLLDVSKRDSKTDYMDTRDPADYVATDYLYHSVQDSINAKVKINNFLSSSNIVTFGISSYRSSRDLIAWYLPTSVGLNQTGNTSINSNAVFAQDDWKFTDKDRVTVGLRKEFFNQNSSAYTAVDPWLDPSTYANQSGKNNLNAYEAQYSREITKSVSDYIKIGQSYRLPNVDDLTRYCADTCIQSLILSPQVNKDFEFGTIYKTELNKGYLKYYRSTITNEILFDKYANSQLGYNINIPQTQHQGIELHNTYKYSSSLSINSNIDLVDAKFLVDSMESATGIYGKRISGTPEYLIGLGADYSINANNSVSWRSRLIGNQFAQGDSNNKFELGAYTISDFSYRWTRAQWSLIANANNVFNKQYGTAILASSGSPNYPYGIYPNWGRNYLVTLRYAFK